MTEHGGECVTCQQRFDELKARLDNLEEKLGVWCYICERFPGKSYTYLTSETCVCLECFEAGKNV